MAKIFCVDSDSEFLDQLKGILRRMGHTVKDVRTLLQANVEVVEAARAQAPFDLLIIEGSMRKQYDGAEWAVAQRNVGYRAIILSGDPSVQRFGDPFLAKPLPSIEQFRQLVIKVLASQAQR